jgi:DNA-binding NtrC family response regulator
VTPRILVVDDDAEMTALLERHLQAEGFDTAGVSSGAAALDRLTREPFAVVVTDLVMEGVGGLDVLREAQRLQPAARVIVMTAFGSLDSAIEAMREGAYDYLRKPFKMAEASLALRRALEHHRLREENRRLREAVHDRYGLDNLVGRSPAMQAVVQQIRDVADSDATLLLLGESGTGKEVVARAIHWNSGRRDAPFVPVNCAAIPETLLESELFGHEKGAFTGAVQRARGLFAEAEKGTLFLDEIGDMPQALQVKLLRALQERAVRPVGGREEIKIDVRVVSATNRDLVALVRDKRFREDLYYRLAVIPIVVPSLRERVEDIPLLARHFARRSAAALGKTFEDFSEGAMAWLQRHRWPGNVRELENVVERGVTLAAGPQVQLADLRPQFAGPGAAEAGVRPTLAELEDDYIRRILAETSGDKRAAARILGVSVRTLQRRTPRRQTLTET